MTQVVDIYSNVIYIGSMCLTILMAMFYKNQNIRHIIENKIIKSVIISSPFALIIGLRSISVGYDTYTYVYYFYSRLTSLPENEFIFSALVRILHYLTDGQNYTVMLMVFSYIAIFLFVYSVESLNVENDLVIAVFAYTFVMGLCLTDQFRQMLAVSVFAYAVSLYIKKKYVFAIMSVLLGYGIHNTIVLVGILFVVCVLVEKEKCTNVLIKLYSEPLCSLKFSKLGVCFIVIAIIVTWLFYSSASFMSFVASMMPGEYASYFTTRVNYEAIGLGLLLDTLPIIPLLFLTNYFETSYERTMFLFSLFVPLFRSCGYVSYFLYRMLYYPEIVAFMLYAIVFRKENVSRKWKCVLLIVCIMYFVVNYVMLNNHGAYPYSFVWQNNGNR